MDNPEKRTYRAILGRCRRRVYPETPGRKYNSGRRARDNCEEDGLFEPVASGVARLGIVFVNVFALGEPGGPWLLVDAGLAGSAHWIHRAVARRFGAGARPEGIVLTHGHFDHVGAARELADRWSVSLYAHPLEIPYLIGRSDYPPRDPTMGGAMAQMSRLMPDHGYDFGDRIHALPPDGGVPDLTGWRWLHTPGHTPGHVSLYREADGVLLAADAFATMNLDSWSAYFTRRRELSRPSPPFTSDWKITHESIERLTELEPRVIAAGHGLEITGADVAQKLRDFAERYTPPRRGRYVGSPPVAGEGGVEELPPPVPDPYARRAVGALAAGTIIFALVRPRRR
jgi:glyoxylase-like metal-dependent hydrolase (beta-lactamase superfamily II)